MTTQRGDVHTCPRMLIAQSLGVQVGYEWRYMQRAQADLEERRVGDRWGRVGHLNPLDG